MDKRIYRGPYILGRVNDKLQFVPAKKVGDAWVALTPEEVEARKT